MSTTAIARRLENIEKKLTPKEWAIRLADEVTKHPTLHDYCTAEMQAGTRLQHQAEAVLLEQAVARYPGSKFDQERPAEIERVQTEFGTLKHLVFRVNETMRTRMDKAAVEVALKLQALQTIILRDAFRETTRTVSEWIEDQKSAGKTTDGRRAILEALAAYQTEPDAQDYPSAAEMWAETTRALAVDLARYKAAVASLQNTYFDGHGILARDIEADLSELVQTVAAAITQHNEYLTGKGQDWLRTVEDDLTTPTAWARALADEWIQIARDMTVLDVLNWMGDTTGRDAYRREIAKRVIGTSGE